MVGFVKFLYCMILKKGMGELFYGGECVWPEFQERRLVETSRVLI